MKKLIVLILAVVLLASLCACGNTDSAKDGTYETDDIYSEETSEDTESTTETIEPEKPVVKTPDFETTTIQGSNKDGYTFDVTVKYTPWMNTETDWDAIEACWEKVSVGKDTAALPEPTESAWNIENGYIKNPYAVSLQFSGDIKMYYSIWTIDIKNTTQDWNITSEKPVSEVITLGSDSLIYSAFTFYSNSEAQWTPYDYGHCINPIVKASMSSNSWGPVRIVVCAFDGFSPKYPNGQYSEKRTSGEFQIDALYRMVVVGDPNNPKIQIRDWVK